MAGSGSQQQALTVSGAGVRGVVGRRGSVAARAVGVGYVLNRAQRHFDPDDARGAIGAPSHSGNAGGLNTAGLLRGAVVRAQSANGVTRHVRGERLATSPCRLPGFTIAGVTARRLAGCSSVGFILGHRSRRIARSTGPSNTQMEPSRPNVLCDPVTAARGSFATVGQPRRILRTTGRLSA